MEIQAAESQNSGSAIPIDLVISILSRVPAKTIARCRCLSKLWRCILCRPYFTELFLTISFTHRHMLLVTTEDENNIYFYSSPVTENPDENTSLVVPATRYHLQQKHTPRDYTVFDISSSLRGFVSLHRQKMVDICDPVTGDYVEGFKVELDICNPVTGDFVSVLKVELKAQYRNYVFQHYTGYDPVDKQLKVVLCIFHNWSYKYQILTLGNGNHSWRTIQCKPHRPRDHPYDQSNGICIDGVLYYMATFYTDEFNWSLRFPKIVCFHVRSEEFSFIDIHEDMGEADLINYKGKLAAVGFKYPFRRGLELWVLQDAEKHIWSKKRYAFPPMLSNIIGNNSVKVLGMIGTSDEFALLSLPRSRDAGPMYIYYFNLESNRITRVQIQGRLQNFRDIYSSLNYYENLKQVEW